MIIVGRATRMPAVSPWAQRFVDNEPEHGFDAFIADKLEEARAKQSEAGKRTTRWAGYTVVSFLVATHAPGWWSFAGWLSTLTWGTGTIFSLEEWNVQRIAGEIKASDFD